MKCYEYIQKILIVDFGYYITSWNKDVETFHDHVIDVIDSIENYCIEEGKDIPYKSDCLKAVFMLHKKYLDSIECALIQEYIKYGDSSIFPTPVKQAWENRKLEAAGEDRYNSDSMSQQELMKMIQKDSKISRKAGVRGDKCYVENTFSYVNQFCEVNKFICCGYVDNYSYRLYRGNHIKIGYLALESHKLAHRIKKCFPECLCCEYERRRQTISAFFDYD